MDALGTVEREKQLSEMRRETWIKVRARQYILGGLRYNEAMQLAKTEAVDLELEGQKF